MHRETFQSDPVQDYPTARIRVNALPSRVAIDGQESLRYSDEDVGVLSDDATHVQPRSSVRSSGERVRISAGTMSETFLF